MPQRGKRKMGRKAAMSQKPECASEQASAWFAGRLPDDWFSEPVNVRVDRDEILVTGRLEMPSGVPDGEGMAEVAAESRIAQFREETRTQRMAVAEAAQAQWLRTVSWVAECGSVTVAFTTASVPVMTRLRFDDRQVLDTLIDAGVVRSRSEALAWCVDQVGQNQSEWIDRLKAAMSEVERIRGEGP